jgi:hypothetical protein
VMHEADLTAPRQTCAVTDYRSADALLICRGVIVLVYPLGPYHYQPTETLTQGKGGRAVTLSIVVTATDQLKEVICVAIS